MKKLSIALAALAWAGLAQAGEYHRLGQLRCSDCHTMHASRQHNFNPATSTAAAFPQGTATITPNPFLLIAGTPDDTCLACHNGQTFAPDVLGVNTAGSVVPMNTRSAGHLNDAVNDSAAVQANGHSLGTGTAPPGLSGITWVGELECASCHAVHGSRAYRNAGLGRVGVDNGFTSSGANSFANVGATYTFVASAAAPDTGYDVSIEAGAAAQALSYLNGTITTYPYETAKIAFGQGSNNATNGIFTGSAFPGVSVKTLAPNGMNTYCAKCHGVFHSDTTSGTDVIRHPTSGVLAGGPSGTVKNLFISAYTGVAGTDPTVTLNSAQGDLVRAVYANSSRSDFEVGCLTCHKAHGNDRPFGLLFPSHVGAVTDYENGDAAALADGTYPIRNLCITCHGMGRTY